MAGAAGAASWPAADLAKASGVGELEALEPPRPGLRGRVASRGAGERSLLSLPPRSRRPGCGRAHLLACGRGLGLGFGTAEFVAFSGGLRRVPGSVLRLQRRLRRGLRGRRQRRARGMLGRGRRPGAAQNPLSSPPVPPCPSPGLPPPPGPEHGGLGKVTGPAAF